MIRKLLSLLGNKSFIRLLWHKSKAFVAAGIHGFPASKIDVIGITGTDGKTTTVHMVGHILHHAGIRTGALSTAAIQIQGETSWNTTQKTSPSPFVVQKFLKKLRKSDCTHAVLEMSSHGLVQSRVRYTWPQVSAITNTSPEHLDYHGTMEAYRNDKSILFFMLQGKGTKVLNRNDGTYEKYSQIPSSETLTYSSTSNEADLYCSSITPYPTRTEAIVHYAGNSYALILPLPGAFNIENALCALSCSVSSGVAIETALEALSTFPGAPGRMEVIDEGQPFTVYVDFTVTPAAYERTLTTLRNIIGDSQRILVLTGSCGDRMKEKRPKVGALCSTLADVVIVTNEDPYTEDPQQIIDDVWAGIDQSTCDASQILDRKEAMRALFAKAQPGDAVILCAKGSDTTMWVKDGQIPWDERFIARELLRELPHD